MRRMSPTPLDRSVSPSRAPAPVVSDSPKELTTLEKLQARVWLMEEELAFATKVQTHSEVEAREWSSKLLAARNRLQQALAEHKKWSDHKRALAEPPPLTEQELEQQQLLEKLKRHIAELGEKRQETIEELEAVKEGIARHKSENELERGNREQLLAEQAELEAKIREVSKARVEQQEQYDMYEASREELIQKELARIEKHVMGKLEVIGSRRRQQEKLIDDTRGEVEELEKDMIAKNRILDVLKTQLVDMEESLKKKLTKKDDFTHSTQGMLQNIEKTKLERAEAQPQLEALVASIPDTEAELQDQVAEARHEAVLCLQEKLMLLEALGFESKAVLVREKIESMKLKIEFCPQFIKLEKQPE